MKIKSYIFILYTLVIQYIMLSGQSEFIGPDNGLPNASITDIAKDKQGYIWATTLNGIIRYDGNQTKVFKAFETQDSISSAFRDIHVAKDGNIYFANRLGVAIYNSYTECFYNINNVITEKKLPVTGFCKIIEDKNGCLWILQEFGNAIYNFDPKLKTVKSFPTGIPEPANRATSFIMTDKNTFIVGKYNGAYIFNLNTGKSTLISIENVFDICQIKDTLFFSTDKGILFISLNDAQNKPIYALSNLIKPNEAIFTSLYTANEKIYYATTNGIKSYKNNTINTELNCKIPLNSKLTALLIDDNNIIWYGIADIGLYYEFPYRKDFQIIKQKTPLNTHYIGNNIFSVFDCEDKIWLGTQKNGISYYTKDDKTFKSIEQIDINKQNESIGVVFSIEKDKNNRMWFGCSGRNSVIILNEVNKAIKTISPQTTLTLDGWSVRDIETDFDGDVWVGTIDGGINLINRDLSGISNRNNNDSIKKYINAGIWHIHADKQDTVWVGTTAGLYSINKSNWAITEYKQTLDFGIRCIFKDNENILWLTTDRGLLKKEGDKIIDIGKYNNLPKQGFYGLIDDDKHLWISYEEGLLRFNKKTGNYIIFDKKDGLSSNQFNYGSFHKAKDGKLFFGSINGITTFYSADIKSNKTEPIVLINEFYINNKKVLPGESFNERIPLQKSISLTDKLVLTHKERVISFDFIAINYQNADKNKYAYQLVNGNDDHNEWIYVSSKKRYASYSNLKPGEYTFKVKASNNDGLWNTKGASIKIEVLPPWWKTWWFRILSIALFISATVSFYFWRVSALRRKQAELEHIVKERTEEVEEQKQELMVQAENLQETNCLLKERQDEIELQADKLMKLNSTKDKLLSIIGHDLKNPFFGITNFSEFLLKNTNIKQVKRDEIISMIKTTSEGASILLENLLLWAKSQTGEININAQTCIVKEIVDENISLLKITADKKQISINSEIDAKANMIADKNMLTTVVRNLLNNAIKFTSKGGNITFTFVQDKEKGLLNISDTGIGMTENNLNKLFKINENISTKGTDGESGTGLGLVVCMDFIKKNKGEILVISNADVTIGKTGTTFTIALPNHKNATNLIREHIKVEETTINNTKSGNFKPEVPLKEIEEATILLVDDEPTIHKSITLNFKGKYTFHTANNGKHGVEKASRILPDLIISDVMMPEMEGTELCSQLKNDSRTSHIPIILLTAKGSETAQIKGINTGADDYIMKPFNTNILEAKVISLIDNRRKLRDKFIKDITLTPKDVTVNKLDREFLEKTIQIIENNIDDIEFDITRFTKEIGMSRTLLHNKLKALTGKSSTEFIRSIRLRKALELIKSGETNISKVYLMVGFNSRPYFYKCFTEQFGKKPGEFKK